ncbi:MAG: hypothetical protein A2Y98_00810 [Candidatus Portnoybacteria bacterium RBG_19FT_COMBO_36_7]|uniref:Uncharacterized protein n=1 Tax=Candidatus Portnoybacteria bacterium RBG_19FT_COMBO_36_7 TaxID=1801992 RepID=A0A1G2F8N7_9BACT|nr:MAG: hypothetical protein A2Y98_00810 [Candidatus Portnoybacteria bacterium RBG_19FT_COMBO_36_7]
MAIHLLNLKTGFASIKKTFVSYKVAVFILLALISLVYIGAMFYFYAWHVKTPEQLPTKTISIDSKLYQKTMDDLKQREINFAEEAGKTYSDPFY